jgi:hypothetical protein
MSWNLNKLSSQKMQFLTCFLFPHSRGLLRPVKNGNHNDGNGAVVFIVVI